MLGLLLRDVVVLEYAPRLPSTSLHGFYLRQSGFDHARCRSVARVVKFDPGHKLTSLADLGRDARRLGDLQPRLAEVSNWLAV